MSLVDFITKLQKQPKYVKTQIKWAGVTILMVILFSFWLWSLGSAVSDRSASQSSDRGLDSLVQIKEDIPTLWQSLGAGIGNLWSSAEQELEGLPAGQSAAPSSSQDRLPVE